MKASRCAYVRHCVASKLSVVCDPCSMKAVKAMASQLCGFVWGAAGDVGACASKRPAHRCHRRRPFRADVRHGAGAPWHQVMKLHGTFAEPCAAYGIRMRVIGGKCLRV